MVEQTFKTSDGETFNTKESAERHESFLTAQQAFENAWNDLKKASINEHLTADGFGFSDANGSWWNERCYVIADSFFDPHIFEVSIYPSNIRDISATENAVEMTVHVYGHHQDNMIINLKNLFKDRKNAETALIRLLQEKIVELTKQISDLVK
jgi:hypothetical protein